MARFKDKTGREWDLSLTIGAIQRVRSATDKRIDLLAPTAPVDGKPLFELLSDDLVECWQVLWLLVEPQAKALAITAEQFGEDMAADCMVVAQDLLIREWADFFRQCQRPDQAAALATIAAGKRKIVETMRKGMETVDLAQVETKMGEQIEAILGRSFGNLPASLAATLGS
jgi:hypothetical protein